VCEGADEVVKEEEEEHAKDGTNDKLVNSAVDDGTRRDGGCRRHCAAAIAAVAAIPMRSGQVVSADLVQAYRSADVGSKKLKLRCTPHHLINVVAPPLTLLLLSIMLSYHTIRYSIHEAKYSKYDYSAYLRRKSIVQKIVHSRNQ
jgi:hypothetical protein